RNIAMNDTPKKRPLKFRKAELLSVDEYNELADYSNIDVPVPAELLATPACAQAGSSSGQAGENQYESPSDFDDNESLFNEYPLATDHLDRAVVQDKIKGKQI
ncbi:MAG: hypothetical protein AAB975_02945, partial [Patescibacteria group bacterium]